MSRKHVIQLDLFKGMSKDMSGSLASREIDVSELDKASIHAFWVAGPEGEFQIQVQHLSEHPIEDTWSTLQSSSAWAVSATDDEMQIVLTEVPFIKMRLVWVPTSGSGTITAYLTTKSQGS